MPTIVRRRDDIDTTIPNRPREPVDDSDADRDRSTMLVRAVPRIPGIRERAPRRNALVALMYLFLAAFLVGLFGWLVGMIPLAIQYTPAAGAPA